MSIYEMMNLVREHCANGTLFPIEPSIQSDPVVRNLYVSAEVNRMLQGPWKTVKEAEEWNTAKAVMDAFISGRLISVGHKKTSYMSTLDPAGDGVWQIRATKPKPGIRILGQFVDKDFFIAMTWEERNILGSYGSIIWKRVIRKCKAEWRKLFSLYPPLRKEDYHDYISNIVLS